MAIITIDGVGIPAPSSLDIDRMDLDSPDTTRNELGYMQRDRVRQGVYKISLGFNAKVSSDIRIIENAIAKTSVNVTFPSPNGMITKKMYVGDRSLNVVLYNNANDKVRWDMSFNLIEY